MATALLLKGKHIVLSHAPPLRTLTLLKAESSLPTRLTQGGPLGFIVFKWEVTYEYLPFPLHSKFESKGIPGGHFLPIISLLQRTSLKPAILGEISKLTSYLEVR